MAETLRDARRSGETGEIIDIEELYRQRGKKILEAARAEKPDEGGQLVEFEQTDTNGAERKGRVLIDDKVDRFGNPAYNKKTLENLREKGVEQDPAEAERAAQIEAARAVSAAERKAKIIEVLNGRSPEFAIQEMQSDIGKWEAEIKEIEAEPASEGGRIELEHDREMVKEMQSRIALIESITPEERAELDRELSTDVIVDTYEDGTTTVREAMPVTTAMADEDFAAEVAKTEGPIEAGAASGELDMNSPLDTDEWQMRRQAVEILKNTEGMPEDLVASVERALQDAEESAVREAQRGEGFLETAPEEMAAGPRMEDIEPVTPLRVQAVENRGETQAERIDRAELQAKVQEKLQKRSGVKYWMRRTAATVLLTLTTMATAFSSSKITAQAAHANQSGGGMRVEAAAERDGKIIEAVRSGAEKIHQKTGVAAVEILGQLAESGDAQAMELVGDLNQDERYEAENGTRYRYDEFDSTEKHGKHGFGTDKSEFWGDVDGTRQSVLEINRAQPEVLAATVSGYPSILTEAGLDANITARELDDLLSNQDGGGELQERLYQLLEEKLGDANTQFEFYQEYGQEYSHYIKNVLGDGELSTPENLELGQSWMQRNGEKQVKIGIPVYNEVGTIDHYEWIDLNSECGWQRNYGEVPRPRQPEQPEQPEQPQQPEQPEQPEQPQQPEQPGDETPDDETPDDEKPDDEKPDDEKPDDETPEDEDNDEDDEEEEEEEDGDKAEKNPENEIANATEGTTGELTDGDLKETTEEPIRSEDNQGTKEGETVADQNASQDEQAATAAEQAAANEAADNTTKVTDDELADAVAREQAIAAANANAGTGN